MDIEYINPFIEASRTVLKQVADIDAKLDKVYVKESPYKADNIMIIVGITGKIRGQVIFSMGMDVALSIASSMMGGSYPVQLDEISKSAVSELANMILGNTATILFNNGKKIEITPPSFLLGENINISASKLKTICLPFLLDDKHFFEIDLAFEEKVIV